MGFRNSCGQEASSPTASILPTWTTVRLPSSTRFSRGRSLAICRSSGIDQGSSPVLDQGRCAFESGKCVHPIRAFGNRGDRDLPSSAMSIIPPPPKKSPKAARTLDLDVDVVVIRRAET